MLVSGPCGAPAEWLLGQSTNPAPAHPMLGRVAMARRDYAEAMGHADAAVSSHGYRVQGLVLAAQIHARTGGAAPALQLVGEADREVAARKFGAIPLLEYTRGDALARLERFDEAEAAFGKEVRDFPGPPRGLRRPGRDALVAQRRQRRAHDHGAVRACQGVRGLRCIRGEDVPRAGRRKHAREFAVRMQR